jgi:hypothetical protein
MISGCPHSRRLQLTAMGAAFCLMLCGATTAVALTMPTRPEPLLGSPNGRLQVRFALDAEGIPRYDVTLDGQAVLLPSRLGLRRDDQDFAAHLTLAGESTVERITDEYTLLTSKRRLNHYAANRRVFDLRARSGEHMHIIFQVSDDGVAFRYEFPRRSASVRRIDAEQSSFRFLPGTTAWLQPLAVAKSGWKEVNPSYEEIYDQGNIVGTPPITGAGWAFPALFHSNELWLLVSEGSLPRNYCASRLRSSWRSTEYTIGFPDPLERTPGGAVNPESSLPWLTPWRFVVIGSLRTIVESTLGTDLAEKPAEGAPPVLGVPGKASWSWPLLGDSATTFDVQKRYIDYAASMHWQYTLIDAWWDQQIGYEKIQELASYAAGKGVKLLLWYNSAGDWNSTPQTPRDRMLTHASRIKEFDRLKAMGIAGLKIDFFGGDGQSMIAYYHDILDDAAPYGFLMNFHGATLPRGWQRTYPQLMTMEAIRGLEFITFDQKNAEDEPSHAAMLPFTRNVFDPMDFTPMVLDHMNGIQRRTTSAFELALSVLFTSGIQHYGETPQGMAAAPDYVQAFLRRVPSVWDDVRFLDGFPGKYVVIARQGDGHWYVAGVNAQPKPLSVHLSFSDVPVQNTATMIRDGEGGNLSFRQETVRLAPDKSLDVTLPAHGGFVLVFN